MAQDVILRKATFSIRSLPVMRGLVAVGGLAVANRIMLSIAAWLIYAAKHLGK
jgi:hypothetical protein